MFTIFFKYISFLLINLPKSSLSVDVRKQLNNQANKCTNKTENANLSFGELKTPTALKLSVGDFGPLINPYWLKEATTSIKILESLGNDLQEIIVPNMRSKSSKKYKLKQLE